MKITKFDIVLLAAIVLYFLENMYFGWNATPASIAEKVADGVVLVGLFYGLIGCFIETIGNSVKPSINITLQDQRPLKVEIVEQEFCGCGLAWRHTGKHRPTEK
jgi:hypothetical protein